MRFIHDDDSDYFVCDSGYVDCGCRQCEMRRQINSDTITRENDIVYGIQRHEENPGLYGRRQETDAVGSTGIQASSGDGYGQKNVQLGNHAGPVSTSKEGA